MLLLFFSVLFKWIRKTHAFALETTVFYTRELNHGRYVCDPGTSYHAFYFYHFKLVYSFRSHTHTEFYIYIFQSLNVTFWFYCEIFIIIFMIQAFFSVVVYLWCHSGSCVPYVCLASQISQSNSFNISKLTFWIQIYLEVLLLSQAESKEIS